MVIWELTDVEVEGICVFMRELRNVRGGRTNRNEKK